MLTSVCLPEKLLPLFARLFLNRRETKTAPACSSSKKNRNSSSFSFSPRQNLVPPHSTTFVRTTASTHQTLPLTPTSNSSPHSLPTPPPTSSPPSRAKSPSWLTAWLSVLQTSLLPLATLASPPLPEPYPISTSSTTALSSDPGLFDAAISDLMARISNKASGSSDLFATGKVNSNGGYPMIYGMVMCTKDLSEEACGDCLVQIRIQIQSCLKGKEWVLGKSCNLRYDVRGFFTEKPDILLAYGFSSPPMAGTPQVSLA